MPYTVKGKQNMVAALGATHVGLASNSNGTTELTGGAPAYARKAVTLSAPDASGVRTVSADVTLDVPAGTVAAICLFDAASAGNLLASFPLGTAETYGSQGTYTVKAGGSLDLNG